MVTAKTAGQLSRPGTFSLQRTFKNVFLAGGCLAKGYYRPKQYVKLSMCSQYNGFLTNWPLDQIYVIG